MSINYTSRYKKSLFCEDDIRNTAKRSWLFVNFEYKAGGEPVFRSVQPNVRKATKKFVRSMERFAIRQRINVARAKRKTFLNPKRPEFKTLLIRAQRASTLAPKRNTPSAIKKNTKWVF